jgi:hypothetical protein
MTDKTTEAAPLHPIQVAVIGTGSVSNGPAPLESGTVATTPAAHQPNLLVTVVSPLAAVLIRFINTYLTILVGLVAAGMTSDAIPSTDFLNLVIKCAGLSVAGAGVGFLKDLLTIFSKLESRYPLLTGNV